MTKVHRIRVIGMALLVAFVGVLILGRLYQLQVVLGDRFHARAEDQHREEVTVQARRGSILDRRGREFAVSLMTRSFYAHPERVHDTEQASRLLAPLLDLPPARLSSRLRTDANFVYLQRFLDTGTAEAVQALDLPGDDRAFGFDDEPKRFYPHGRLGVHVIGYATIDGKGVEGIERQYDDVLQGDPTVYVALKDARNGQRRIKVRAPERESRDVLLTLDLVVQHIVERELDQVMERSGARAATAIVIEPATGQILALANRPAVDLNDFGAGNDQERVNRAVVHCYEPGSTFKIISMAAVLEHGRWPETQLTDCENGKHYFGRRRIRDSSPHGVLTTEQVFEKSSNIGMVKLVGTLKPEQLHGMIEKFGFGSKTGIELPGESRGIFAPLSDWSGFSQDSLSFGHEISVTALQMAAAVATVANDGVLIPPSVVLGVRTSDGKLIEEPTAAPVRVISRHTAQRLRRMLEGVVERGTGKTAAAPGYRVAGKTGTAQMAVRGGMSDTDYVASFVGYAPSEQPRLAVLVAIHRPRLGEHHGGQAAAPIFSSIVSDTLRYLRVPTNGAPTVQPARHETMPTRPATGGRSG